MRAVATEQQDLFTALLERDQALGQVEKEPWHTRAVRAVSQLPAGAEYTGEEIRLALSRTMEQPHHHNAWGAVIMQAVKRKHLRPTDRFRQMRTAKSHARVTRVYEITGG
jgi:hypothetical protein